MSNIKVQSKRVEPSRAESDSARLGICVRYAFTYAVPLQKWPQLFAARAYRHVAFVLLRFCTWIFLQPPIRSWTWLQKPIFHRIQRYILRREILSTFHTRVDHRSVRHFCIAFTPKLPLPLRRSPPKVNTPIPSPTPLTTPNGIRIQSAVLPLLTRANRQMGQVKALSHERSAHIERRANNITKTGSRQALESEAKN